MSDKDIPSVPVTTLAGLTSLSDCKYIKIDFIFSIKYTFNSFCFYYFVYNVYTYVPIFFLNIILIIFLYF